MAGEEDFLALMRDIAADEAARGLRDDAAVLRGAGDLVLTTDTLVEGVHYLPDDPPESIAWKLAAVNLSDLAAKGARPVGCLVNYALGDAAWNAAFARGLAAVLGEYAMPLLGGDTVAMPAGAPRSLTLTALGRAGVHVPSRAGARPGDILYVTGPVGDAGAGLALLQAGKSEPASLVEAYRRPRPALAQGLALAPHAHATMDISDGLLIDAARMASASGVVIRIDRVPLSSDYRAFRGEDEQATVAAATAGDDYGLLLALPADFAVAPGHGLIAVGAVAAGQGLSLSLDGRAVALPPSLGWTHRSTPRN